MKIKPTFALLAVAAAACAGIVLARGSQGHAGNGDMKEITPVIGPIRNYISSTATILPKNRLEVKVPVNGRIDRILVREGDVVKAGQVVAWMSSTERAALLDAARGKGEESLKYWEEIYKPIPLSAPIDAEVIVATTQPGQTLTTSDAVIVLSDRLIVRAQVDETDIGKISPDMKAVISLDAYPDSKVTAVVEHIYYESKTVNNVTIYEVDLVPEELPKFFRSGMNAAVDFIEKSKDDALLIPAEAVQREKDSAYCLLRQEGGRDPVRVRLTLGMSDEKNVEVLAGLGKDDRVLVKPDTYRLPKNNRKKNPFMPR